SYRLDLSSSLWRHGVHDMFHSSLLQIHEANDDRLFLGRLDSQFLDLDDPEGKREWFIGKILLHCRSATDAIFEVLWTSGDCTWVPYVQIPNVAILSDYLELLGIE
ncbi:hypothetical protein OBBRIDRAFT_692892, partial [Obba rivulosa]